MTLTQPLGSQGSQSEGQNHSMSNTRTELSVADVAGKYQEVQAPSHGWGRRGHWLRVGQDDGK